MKNIISMSSTVWSDEMDLDSRKVNAWKEKFAAWKKELFPREEYAHRNECCFAFAHLLAEKAKEEGLMPIKIWCLKSYDSESVEAKFPAANEQGFEKRCWQGYHVALALDVPIYQNSAKTERLVFDPVVFSEPVRVSDWSRALNSGEPYILYSGCKFGTEAAEDKSFFDGSGYWLDKDPKMDLSRHARCHIKAVDCRTPAVSLLKSPLSILAARASRIQMQTAMAAAKREM